MLRAPIGLILISVAISSLAQIMLKAGMASLPIQRLLSVGLKPVFVLDILLTPYILVGLMLYFVSAAIWLLVLAKLPVSTAYPFVALGFVFTAALGKLVFDDVFSPAKIAATLLIVSGVVVMALA